MISIFEKGDKSVQFINKTEQGGGSLTNKMQNLHWLWCSIKQDKNKITYDA